MAIYKKYSHTYPRRRVTVTYLCFYPLQAPQVSWQAIISFTAS